MFGVQSRNLVFDLLDFIGMQLSSFLPFLDLFLSSGQVPLRGLKLPLQKCPPSVDHFSNLDRCGRMNPIVSRSLDSREPLSLGLLSNPPLSAT